MAPVHSNKNSATTTGYLGLRSTREAVRAEPEPTEKEGFAARRALSTLFVGKRAGQLYRCLWFYCLTLSCLLDETEARLSRVSGLYGVRSGVGAVLFLP